MIFDLILLLLMIILVVISAINIKKKKQKVMVIIISTMIIIFNGIFSFGISFTAKKSYEIRNKFNDYEYLMDYPIDNNTIVISMKEKNNDTKIYNITILNNILGLYFVSNKKYDIEGIYILENKDFEILSVDIDSKKYYFIDFNDSKITSLQINNQIIDPNDKSYCVFYLDDKINSLIIDNNDYTWYNVEFPS